MQTYLVCYDIADPKRLRKVATICEDFGRRYQFSVFFCRLSATDFVRLRSRLYDCINLAKDQVMFIPVCGGCVSQMETLGKPMPAPESHDVVLVV